MLSFEFNKVKEEFDSKFVEIKSKRANIIRDTAAGMQAMDLDIDSQENFEINVKYDFSFPELMEVLKEFDFDEYMIEAFEAIKQDYKTFREFDEDDVFPNPFKAGYRLNNGPDLPTPPITQQILDNMRILYNSQPQDKQIKFLTSIKGEYNEYIEARYLIISDTEGAFGPSIKNKVNKEIQLMNDYVTALFGNVDMDLDEFGTEAIKISDYSDEFKSNGGINKIF